MLLPAATGFGDAALVTLRSATGNNIGYVGGAVVREIDLAAAANQRSVGDSGRGGLRNIGVDGDRGIETSRRKNVGINATHGLRGYRARPPVSAGSGRRQAEGQGIVHSYGALVGPYGLRFETGMV